MEIKFTTGDSPLGNVLVAATDKGVCTVSLRESEEGAEETLRARFPKATLDRDDAALKPALDSVLGRIAGRNLDSALPLDLQGTDFQREVWNQLLAIPPGSTRSYLDVAQAIKRPKATPAITTDRAVAHYDAMAWHHHRHRICSARLCYSASCLRPLDRLRHVEIRRQLAL